MASVPVPLALSAGEWGRNKSSFTSSPWPEPSSLSTHGNSLLPPFQPNDQNDLASIALTTCSPFQQVRLLRDLLNAQTALTRTFHPCTRILHRSWDPQVCQQIIDGKASSVEQNRPRLHLRASIKQSQIHNSPRGLWT